MDRKNWPWRKKSSEKILGPNDSVESSPTLIARHLDDDQIMPRDCMGFISDEGTAHWQQAEEKVEQLKERLSVALLDASAKDVIIKQHAKVAEEAVSGWEKAEAEALNLKQDLESVMQQKLATEDRVSHLDGALKECMWQLRHVREEEAAKIHDVTMKNLREWERKRAELEERLLDMEQKYLDADAENKANSKLLQERAAAISELSEAYSCAKVNSHALQIRLEAIERDHSALKCECSNLKRELDIQNEEKVHSRRSMEAASKQHFEDARKIAKLEGECQRLRGLVRKKLPGSGVSMPIKLEADSSRLKNDSNRKKIGKGAANLSQREEDLGPSKSQQESPSGGKDVESLLDRLNAMEDETRRLKELLARRDNELQHSRLMCARTASKLSSVEEQLECLSSREKGSHRNAGISALDKHIEAARSFTVSCEPSLASVSEDGNDDCSDAWASALISELAHIKIGKVASSPETGSVVPEDKAVEVDPTVSLAIDDTKCLEQKLAQKDVELYAAHQLCEQVGDKLRFAEKELATLQSQNAETHLSLQALQSQLDAILQAQDNGGDMDAALDQVREAIGIPHQRMGQTLKQLALEPNLTSAVSMLVRVVESLGDMVPASALLCKSNNIKAKIKEFCAESQLFFQGATDTVQFLEDLALIIGDYVKREVAERDKPPCATIKARLRDRISLNMQETDALSTMSDTSEGYAFEEQANKALHTDKNRVSITLHELEVARLEGELRKVQGEKVALETHLKMEFQRFEGLHNEVSQLQRDKLELEHLIEVVREELDNVRRKLHQAEQAESNFQDKLSSAEASRQLLEEQLQSLTSTKAEVEVQLKAIKGEHVRLQDIIGALERECLEKNEKIAGLESNCQELANQRSESSVFVCLKCSTTNGGEPASKEQEIAVKLAECQQTISLLGKQLQTFTSSKELSNGYHDPSTDMLEGYPSPKQYSQESRGSAEVRKGTRAYRHSRIRAHARRGMEWESQRDSNASDALDSELMSLSKSGRPLLELFGDKTPAHEHYIQAVEQLTSSSDDDFVVPKREEPLMAMKSSVKPPLHGKEGPRSYAGVDMSKSMDDTSSEKHHTFSRFFSRAKNS